MTGPEKVEGYKSKDNRIWNNKGDAIRADMCQLIIDYTDKHKLNPNDLFSFGKIIEQISKDEKLKRMERTITSLSLESEMETLFHWITKNTELLEILISYYVEAMIDKPKEEAKK